MNYYLDVSLIKEKGNLVQKVKKLVSNSSSKFNVDEWNDKTREDLVELFGLVSAGWSLLELEEEDINSGDYQYLEPNNAQILSILCLLGVESRDQFLQKFNLFGSQKSSFQNQIIEILTGEGKSIIIGLMSTMLGLMGYEVHAVCYSSYLSQRDYDSF